MRTIGFLGAGALLGVLGCQQAETPQQMQTRMDQESAAFMQFLTGFYQRWASWTAAAQSDSFAAAFMEQGRWLPPNAPAAVGRQGVRAFVAGAFSTGKFTVRVRPEVAMANGPLGVERGSFTLSFTPNPGTQNPMFAPADTGKYLSHWHKVNGTWLIAESAYNSNLPPPSAAPTKAPTKGKAPARAPAKRK